MSAPWKILLCWLTGHLPDDRGDILNHCSRCGHWMVAGKLSVDPNEQGR
jgi:hypothetical protein